MATTFADLYGLGRFPVSQSGNQIDLHLFEAKSRHVQQLRMSN